eukprot:scpid49092/ scgid20340/ 
MSASARFLQRLGCAGRNALQSCSTSLSSRSTASSRAEGVLSGHSWAYTGGARRSYGQETAALLTRLGPKKTYSDEEVQSAKQAIIDEFSYGIDFTVSEADLECPKFRRYEDVDKKQTRRNPNEDNVFPAYSFIDFKEDQKRDLEKEGESVMNARNMITHYQALDVLSDTKLAEVRRYLRSLPLDLLRNEYLLPLVCRMLLHFHTPQLLLMTAFVRSAEERELANEKMPDLRLAAQELRSLLDSQAEQAAGDVAVYLQCMAATEEPELVEAEMRRLHLTADHARARHFAAVAHAYAQQERVADVLRLFYEGKRQTFAEGLIEDVHRYHMHFCYHVHPGMFSVLVMLLGRLDAKQGVESPYPLSAVPEIMSDVPKRPTPETIVNAMALAQKRSLDASTPGATGAGTPAQASQVAEQQQRPGVRHREAGAAGGGSSVGGFSRIPTQQQQQRQQQQQPDQQLQHDRANFNTAISPPPLIQPRDEAIVNWDWQAPAKVECPDWRRNFFFKELLYDTVVAKTPQTDVSADALAKYFGSSFQVKMSTLSSESVCRQCGTALMHDSLTVEDMKQLNDAASYAFDPLFKENRRVLVQMHEAMRTTPYDCVLDVANIVNVADNVHCGHRSPLKELQGCWDLLHQAGYQNPLLVISKRSNAIPEHEMQACFSMFPCLYLGQGQRSLDDYVCLALVLHASSFGRDCILVSGDRHTDKLTSIPALSRELFLRFVRTHSVEYIPSKDGQQRFLQCQSRVRPFARHVGPNAVHLYCGQTLGETYADQYICISRRASTS